MCEEEREREVERRPVVDVKRLSCGWLPPVWVGVASSEKVNMREGEKG